MNAVLISGRIISDDLTLGVTSSSGKEYAEFTITSNRPGKNNNDIVIIRCYGIFVDYMKNHFKKGKFAQISGTLKYMKSYRPKQGLFSGLMVWADSVIISDDDFNDLTKDLSEKVF